MRTREQQIEVLLGEIFEIRQVYSRENEGYIKIQNILKVMFDNTVNKLGELKTSEIQAKVFCVDGELKQVLLYRTIDNKGYLADVLGYKSKGYYRNTTELYEILDEVLENVPPLPKYDEDIVKNPIKTFPHL